MENDLKFAGVSPVIINYNGEAEDIYAPVRGSSCDVAIVSPHILDDLYTAQKDEVCVRIEKDEPVMEEVVTFDDYGSCEAAEVEEPTAPSAGYQIQERNLFYLDFPSRNLRFNGRIRSGNNEPYYPVNLLFDTVTNKWVIDNYWKLNIGDWYFDDNDNVYRVTNENGSFYVYDWNGSKWINKTPYTKEENGSYTNCAYKTDNIVHWQDAGIIELVWGQETWGWDAGNKRWDSRAPYTDIDGQYYFAIYGKTYNRIKDSEGNLIDTLVVNGYSDEIGNWVIKTNPYTRTFKRMIPLDDNDTDNLFTNDEGDLCKFKNKNEIWFWSWDLEQWVKWIEIEPNNFNGSPLIFDYEIPNLGQAGGKNYKGIVGTGINRFGGAVSVFIKNIVLPTAHIEEVWTGEYEHKTVWEGYKMPNTYTQDVTLNLDTIQMTSIDPVSLMKYVKIDRILTEPAILTYSELIGKALSYVMISVNKLFIERSVTYGGPYEGDNGLLDLKCQVSNFWDEMGEPSDCYSMIEELLRPFCLVLAFAGDSYQIYNQNKTQGDRTFEEYQIDEEGVLHYVRTITENKTVFDHYYNDWKSNNVQSASIEIGSTYSKVTGTASTKVPEYSTMAIDKVDYNDRNAYDVFDANIQTNKSKGYEYKSTTIRPVINDKDKWFYIWNGVYVNEDYGLKSQGDYVNGYLNINGAYKYLTGDSGHPADWGSILNFYGGSLNPTGTGKEQSTERSVGVKKRITAYSPDNGTPLEFLEDSDLLWDYNGNVTYSETVNINPEISKPDSSDSKFGNPIVMRESNQITYHQEYENLRLESTNQQTVDLNLVQSYSRTGIDTKINIMNNNTCYDKHFLNYENQNWLDTAKVNYFPVIWESENVVVDKYYFSRYRTQETLLRPSRVKPVWDRRRVDIYIKTSDNKIYQFNGKEWVEDTEVKESNSIYLLKMMNGEHLYHTDFRYDVIETADYDSSNPNAGGHYSLTGEKYTYYVDEVGGVTTKSVSGGTTYYCDPYTSEENVYLDKCSEGSISIKLPELDDFSATVVVDIYNSSMLGSTGSDDTSSYNHYENIWFEDPDENVIASSTHILFKPYNTTYVKAEHLDLDISMSVPQSNLGQMFSQSDIKYTIDNYRNCLEEFQGPSFLVNTFNDLVLSSFSYLIFDNNIADPGDFIIAGVGSRPECFTVQAYMNWLSVIRKIYNKTLVPVDKEKAFNNIRTYITSPETGEYELMVISDSWDLKTNRHTIKAIEDHNLDVDYVGSFAVIEIPRKARNDLFNLPTAVKK